MQTSNPSTRRRNGSSRAGVPMDSLSSPVLDSRTPATLRVLSLASSLLSRSNFASRHGVTFDGVRDYYESLGYKRDLRFKDYYDRYKRGGIAGRIIDIFPEAIWKEGIEIIESEDPTVTTQFESQITQLWTDNNLSITSKLKQVHILERIYDYSCLLIGALEPGSPKWDQPLSTQLNGPDSILFFTPLSSEQAQIVEPRVKDESSPRWGLPEYYNIIAEDGSATRKVHWTRVVHVCQNPLGSSLRSAPCLERVWNWLDDLEFKLIGGGSEACWNRADPGYHADVRDAASVLGSAFVQDDDTDAGAHGTTSNASRERALEDELSAFKHKLKRFMVTQGIDVNQFASEKVDFGSNVDSLAKLIAGSYGIPVSILFGNLLGLRASESDTKERDKLVASARAEFASPLLNTLITRLIDHGALVKPDEYQILWPVEEESPEKEKAEVTEIWARANQAQFHCEGRIILSADEIRDRQYGLEPLPDMIEEDVVTDVESNQPDDTTANDNDEEMLLQAASMDRRVIIIGGPRFGKSTLARNFRTQGIPTYCGDPASMVKEPESGVTYLPESLEWSEGSQYIADHWFTMPAPWCCEGVGMVRALRKLVDQGNKSAIDGVMILVRNRPVSGMVMSTGQRALALGVQTVWNGIKHEFPNAINLDAPANPVTIAANRSSMPMPKDRDRALRTHKQLRRQKVTFKVR